MAFEFVGDAVRGVARFFSGLGDEVGNDRTNNEDDVVNVKRTFGALDRYDEPDGRVTGYIDRPLDTAIRGFQRDKGLRVDGFLRPGGPSGRSLQEDVRGRFRRDGARNGEDSRLSGRDRGRSLLETASSEPSRLKPALDKMERNLRRTVEGWREEGMTDAARHLEHFLGGSGEPITYNRDQARSFSPVRSAEEDAQAQIRAELLDEARKLKDGESRRIEVDPRPGNLTIRHGLNLLRGLLGDRDRLDDNLATGRTLLDTTFEGTISRNGDDIAVGGNVEYDWRDRYDFPTGQLGGDAALSLQKYRGARPFDFGSRWRQRLGGTIERRRERLLPNLRFDDVD